MLRCAGTLARFAVYRAIRLWGSLLPRRAVRADDDGKVEVREEDAGGCGRERRERKGREETRRRSETVKGTPMR